MTVQKYNAKNICKCAHTQKNNSFQNKTIVRHTDFKVLQSLITAHEAGRTVDLDNILKAWVVTSSKFQYHYLK